ncbi:MAG: Lrp/AsnC family transcriptional regulator [Nanopusillaceae archaeon]
MVRKSKIDEIDLKILKILEKNSRIHNTQIAKFVGITEAAVRKRIEKLKRIGIIRKFTIELDYKLLDYKLVIIGINVQKNKLFDVIKKIPKIENLKSIYISVGDHDILLEFVYKEQEDLEKFIKIIKEIDGVTDVCPAILIEKVF